ncbi:fused MFS/spermidine synthase [Streptomyces sp. NPDC000594]|uniref:spermidine synthase n=1 Tax=Streptomyces sp. NPDC000594 TaxID=3154261 RepID=UPI00331A8FA5
MNEPLDEPRPVIRDVDFGTARLLPDVDRPRAWLLTVDGAPQSYVDLDAPAHLEFEYTRRLAHAIAVHPPAGTPLDIVHLGAGALALPRQVAAVRPGSRQLAVEADRGLIALVGEVLPLPADSGIEVRAADARDWIETAPAASADVVVADVYGGSRVPARLTSLEYARAAARVLRPGGIHAANLADGTPFDFLRGQLATWREVLPELAVVAEAPVLRGRRFGNVVVLAAGVPPDLAALTRRVAADPFPARVVHGAALDRLIGDARPVTDASARPSPRPPDGTFGIG